VPVLNRSTDTCFSADYFSASTNEADFLKAP